MEQEQINNNSDGLLAQTENQKDIHTTELRLRQRKNIYFIGGLSILMFLLITLLIINWGKYVKITPSLVNEDRKYIEQEDTDSDNSQYNFSIEDEGFLSWLPEGSSNRNCDSLDIDFSDPQKINNSDKAYIVCISEGVRKRVLELTDMNFSHYHGYQLVNGDIYLVRRIGLIDDELWIYAKDGKSKKLASSLGLDFRVSSSGDNVVVEENNNKFLIINNIDNSQTEIDTTDYLSVSAQKIDIEGVTDEHLWLVEKDAGPHVLSFHKVSLADKSIRSYLLPKEISGFTQYDFNLVKDLVAYTDYPVFYDSESFEEWEKSNALVKLSIYDLKTGDNDVIAEGYRTVFKPDWIDDVTLKYANPNGVGTLQKSF